MINGFDKTNDEVTYSELVIRKKGEVFKNAETLRRLLSSAAPAARYVVDEALILLWFRESFEIR